MAKFKIPYIFLTMQLIATAGFSVSAQTFDHGIKGGASLNYIKFEYRPDPDWFPYKDVFKHRTAFHVGLFMSIDLTDRLSYRQELEYIQKGARQEADPSQNLPAANFSISYLQLPVLFAVKVADKFLSKPDLLLALDWPLRQILTFIRETG